MAKQRRSFWQRLVGFFRREQAKPRSAAAAASPAKIKIPPRLSKLGNAGAVESPGQFNTSVITTLRNLAISDSDVYGAIKDLQTLANPGYIIRVVGKNATKAIEDLEMSIPTWFNSGDLDTFINNQIFELTIAGASSCEWYPDKKRSGVEGVVVIPAEEVEITRTEEGTLKYVQAGSGQKVELNPVTYKYLPSFTMGKSPVGIPIIYPGLGAYQRKLGMQNNMDRMLKILGLTGIVQGQVALRKPEEMGYADESDPEYQLYVQNTMEQIAELLTQGEEEGVFVTPQGVEINIVSPARELGYASTAWVDNQFQLWSGVRTTPFMRGRSESLSETWAKVAYPMILAEAKNLQSIVKSQVEYGLNLHLAMRGFIAHAKVEFRSPESPFRESDARSAKLEAERDQIYEAMFPGEWSLYRREQIGLPRLDSNQDSKSKPGGA